MRENPDVLATFELLVEEIEKEMERTQDMLRTARKGGEYERVKALSRRVQFLSELLQKVVGLREEYERASREGLEEVGFIERRPRRRRHLPRGARTPLDAFYRPILQTLVEMGGSARVKDVLDRVGELMREKLTEFDLQPLSSGEPRWRNMAQWARYRMVLRGWLRRDSPHGVWEISEEGRKALEEGLV